MKRVTVTELRGRLARHLRAAERGLEIEITRNGKPIGRLVPAGIVIRPAERPMSALRNKRFRPAKWKTDSLTLLLEDRRRR